MSVEPSGELPLLAPAPSRPAENRPAGGGSPLSPLPDGEPATSPDVGLLARLRAGDEDAVAEMVASCAGQLLAAARRFLRDEEDARDAVQESLIKAYQSIGSFQGGSRLSTWVHRILINGCLMRLRSRRRKPEEPIEEMLPGFLEDGHQDRPSGPWRHDAADELIRKETRALVRATIDRLPETYRTVLLLRDIEELDTSEVAALLACTENAVKIRLHRARQALRELLSPSFEVRPA